ncbi:MAG: hypothetical protein ACI3ZP_07380 [Candidatus Cryptobacteroides sp.]
MEANNESRVMLLMSKISEAGNYIDEVSKWLNGHTGKSIDGNSFGDVMTAALFGGGIIGMAISKKIRTGLKNKRIIYKGMTADDMGQDIVNRITGMVNSQIEIQQLVGKEDDCYYSQANYIYSCWRKYHSAWMMFTSYYSTNHKVDYEGRRITLEEMVRFQCVRQLQRLDFDENTRKAIEKEQK